MSHWLMHRPVERCKHEEAFGYGKVKPSLIVRWSVLVCDKAFDMLEYILLSCKHSAL